MIVAVATAMVVAAASGASTPPALQAGSLPASWPTGAVCPEPEFRAHDYNDDFIILRQSGCTNFEKPFLYLIFGSDRALLVDTGAKGADVRSAVEAARGRWAARHNGRALPLIVIHSHGHGDHTAGDSALAAVPGVRVVGATPAELQGFLGLRTWPDESGTIELGNRIVDVVPIPGHEAASIALYDRRTGVLLTGDTLYPGRLYVRDAQAFAASVHRLVLFTAERPVAHVLGAHIEQSRTSYVDYPEGTTSQPDEHPLELGRAHLLELDEALRGMNGAVIRREFRDFTIVPITPKSGG